MSRYYLCFNPFMSVYNNSIRVFLGAIMKLGNDIIEIDPRIRQAIEIKFI